MHCFVTPALADPEKAAQAESAATAQAARNIPIADFYKGAEYASPVLSPNGEKVAILVRKNGRLKLAVLDLTNRKSTLVSGSDDWDIVAPRWVNNSRLIFSISDTKAVMADNHGGGLFAINDDGTGFRRLGMTVKQAMAENMAVYRPVSFISRVEDDSNDILVACNERSGDDDFAGIDVYRMDTTTGKKKLLTFESPGHVLGWVIDGNHEVRVAIAIKNDEEQKKLKRFVYYRDNSQSKWRLISSSAFYEPGYTPVGFDRDGKTMYVVGRAAEDKDAMYKWDFANNKPGDLVIAHPQADVSGSLIYDKNHQVVGVRVEAMKLETYYFDDSLAELQAQLDKAIPDRINLIQVSGKRALIHSVADTDKGQIYLMDLEQRKLEKLFDASPRLIPKLMGHTNIFNYPARDGLNIPAYLTIPPGTSGKNLPLVAYIHGGPQARDEWGYDPIVQQLATRGYAVFQPQFRMSTGLGWNLFHSGWKQWGLAMQDDITDGIEKLIKDGVVDRNRICIMGASYGGYATMYGVAKDPDLYKCGVNFVGVTDISLLYSVTWGDTADSPFAKYMLKEMHGDPDKDQDYMKKASVLENADRIKAPVLMAYGSDDHRVPFIHGQLIRDKLLKQGNTVEWKVYTGEGHGWAKLENKIDWGNRFQSFIDRYIGDQAQMSSK